MQCPHCDMQLVPVQRPLDSQLYACPGCGEVSEAEPNRLAAFSDDEVCWMSYALAYTFSDESPVGGPFRDEWERENKRRREEGKPYRKTVRMEATP